MLKLGYFKRLLRPQMCFSQTFGCSSLLFSFLKNIGKKHKSILKLYKISNSFSCERIVLIVFI